MRAENDDANTNIFKIHSYDMIFRRKHKMQCNFERVLSYTVAIFVPLLHKYSNQHAINNKFLYGSLFLQLFISWCNFPSDSLSLSAFVWKENCLFIEAFIQFAFYTFIVCRKHQRNITLCIYIEKKIEEKRSLWTRKCSINFI